MKSRKKLVIISHTAHYKSEDGTILGWGPTVNEVNYLAEYWEEVTHIGILHKTEAPSSSIPYTKSNIQFVPIPPYGGQGITSKLLIFTKMPTIIRLVSKNIKNATEVQLRLPTAMGLFLLPFFSYFVQRKFTFWVKYAGNWNQRNPPVSYLIQRWWLIKNIAKCNVTINGFWPDQASHCLSFENPCLTEDQLEKGKQIALKKSFEGPYNFVFAGRLEDAKGVSRIIEGFKQISSDKIKKVHFIGDDLNMETYKKQAAFLGDKVSFYGYLDSKSVHHILKEMHFFLLPSKASEGFPKVIAEAACYGAIPIVSTVGSISHYVNQNNGFLWDPNTGKSYGELVQKAVDSSPETLKQMAVKVTELAAAFTFDNYLQKLEATVFKDNT